jgi:hypothetical protein
MENVCAVLRTASKPGADEAAIVSSLSSLTPQRIRKESTFSALATALVDHVAAWLAIAAEPSCGEASRHFDRIFLDGPPVASFDALVSGLSGSPGTAATCAQTLSLFVDRRLAGLRRVAAIVSAPVQSRASTSTLVHLPALVANACRGSLHCKSLEDETYCSLLGDALLLSRNDLKRTTEFASVLTGKLCCLGKAPSLVRGWCLPDGLTPANAEAVANMILAAPPSSLTPLLRSLVAMGDVLSKSADHVNDGVADLEMKASFVDHGAAGFLKEFSVREEALSIVFVRSESARIFWAIQAPFSYPLFAKPRVSFSLLVRSLQAAGALFTSLASILKRWADPSFCFSEDVALQHQVTTALLLQMALCFGEPDGKRKMQLMEGLAMEVATGVSMRLSSAQPQVKRYGMLVGEAASRCFFDDKPLRFERHPRSATAVDIEGCESDGSLSDVAQLRFPEAPHGELSESKEAASAEKSRLSREEVLCLENEETVSEDWGCSDDDWSTLDSYPASDSDDGYDADADSGEGWRSTMDSGVPGTDLAALRKEIGAPFSVPRVLGVLRKLNTGDSDLVREPELILATLRTLRELAENMQSSADKNEAFVEGAVELASVVFGVDWYRFPPTLGEKISNERKRVLVALVLLDIACVGGMFVDDLFCSERSDVGRRLEALNLVCSAARDLQKRQESSADSASHELAVAAASACDSAELGRLGLVSKEFTRSLHQRQLQLLKVQRPSRLGTSSRSKLLDAAEPLFYSIAAGLADLEHAVNRHAVETRLLEEQNVPQTSTRADAEEALAAQALVTLGVLVNEGPAGRRRDDLAAALVDLTSAWRYRGGAVARRAAALSLGCAATAVSTGALVSGDMDVGTGLDSVGAIGASGCGAALAWLRHAADGNDADVHVRQFAGASLRMWGAKIADARSGGSGGRLPMRFGIV